MYKKPRAFTLIELILVLTMLAIMAISGASMLGGYQRDSDFTTSAQTIVTILRRAQAKAIAGEGTNNWGVHLDTSVAGEHFVTLFQGATYAAATDTEQTSLLNASILSQITLNGGGNDVIFSRLTGLTTTYGTGTNNRAFCVADVSDSSGCKKSITINSNGRINLE